MNNASCRIIQGFFLAVTVAVLSSSSAAVVVVDAFTVVAGPTNTRSFGSCDHGRREGRRSFLTRTRTSAANVDDNVDDAIKTSNSNSNSNSINNDDAIQKQLAKARKLIQEAKAKVAASEAAAAAATSDDDDKEDKTITSSTSTKIEKDEQAISKRKSKIVKTQNAQTGLITTDGELMAALSEEEEWEMKSLIMDIDEFEGDEYDENNENIDRKKRGPKSRLADRDVAASIFNLRMRMKDEDYRRIFNKKQFLIGDDN